MYIYIHVSLFLSLSLCLCHFCFLSRLLFSQSLLCALPRALSPLSFFTTLHCSVYVCVCVCLCVRECVCISLFLCKHLPIYREKTNKCGVPHLLCACARACVCASACVRECVCLTSCV